MKDWKSTAAGVLSFLVTTLTVVSGILGAGDVNNMGTLQTRTYITTGVLLALALCRAWIGLLQKDAGTVLAVTPASPIVPMQVPAHEIPNDPAAIPVTKVLPLVLLALLLCAMLVGCKPVTSPTPTTAPSIYQQGAQVMDDFATDLQSAQSIEKNLYVGGVIPQPTHKAIENTFGQIAGYGHQIDGLIAAQASSTTIVQRINSAISSLSDIVSAAAKLDPNTAAQVRASVAALQALLSNLIPIFGGQ